MFSFAAVKAKIGIIFFFCMVQVSMTVGQILDDSSQLVYGPSTTLQFTQAGWMRNKLDTIPVDTSLFELEKFAFTDRLMGRYQDLGNIGTALNPLFYQAPQLSGVRSGYHAYDPIVTKPDGFTYFDTKSPFIDLNVVLGRQGRNVIDVLYTQNVNPNWNIGLFVNRLNIDKQLGAVLNEGDRNLESSQINFFTQYQHPEKPYRVLGYYNQFNHQVREVGGVYYTDSATNAEIYQYRDAGILLKEATANDRRQDLHLYQSYGFFKFFELYHQADFNRQKFTYADFVDGQGGSVYDTYRDFYPAYFLDEDSTFQSLRYRNIQNELGVKGGAQGIFYRFYARHRQIKYEWLYLNEVDPIHELYVGAITRFDWKELFAVSAQGELLNTGDYLLKSELSSELLNVSYQSQRYQADLLKRQYFGNHFEWRNSFNSIYSNDLSGQVNLSLNRFRISPEVRFTTLTNYVYYNQNIQPEQLSGTLLISRFGLSSLVKLWTNKALNEGFVLDQTGYFSGVTGDDPDAFPVPQWLVNARWYWSGNWFQKAIPIEIGFNFHFKSGYYGRAYMPAIQQFYIQQEEFLDGYFTIDPFISMKVNRVFVFAKLTHANMLPSDGYLITPRYPGQERVFDFGVRWIFFD